MKDKGKPSAALRVHDEILKEAMRTYTAAEAVELTFGKEAAERFKEEMAKPNAVGWRRLWEMLHEARNDKQIASSPGASEFLELMHELAIDAVYAQSAEEAVQPLIEIIISARARRAANKGSAEERRAKEWVISEWNQYKAEYPSKSDFAHIYVQLVRNKFGVKRATDRNIRERWLKGL